MFPPKLAPGGAWGVVAASCDDDEEEDEEEEVRESGSGVTGSATSPSASPSCPGGSRTVSDCQ